MKVRNSLGALLMSMAILASAAACGPQKTPSSGETSGESTGTSLSTPPSDTASEGGDSTDSTDESAAATTGSSNKPGVTNASSKTTSGGSGSSGTSLLKGKTVKISSFYEIATARGTSEAGDALLDRVTKVEKKYGCNVEFVVKGQTEYYRTLLNSCLAGTPHGDIIDVSHKFILDYARKGVLEPLNNYAAYKEMLGKQYSSTAAAWMTFGGKTYGVCPQPLDIRNLILFNKRILKENGLPEPYALAKKGEWTWSKFTEYAKKCVRYNEDGYMTTYGFHGDVYTVIAQTIASNNGEIIAPVNGKYTFLMDSVNSMEALNQVDKWMHVDKILNTGRNAWDDSMKLFERGLVAFMMCPGIWVPNERFNTTMPNEDYGMIYYPKGPKANGYVVSADGNGENYAIPTATKLDKNSLIRMFGEIMTGEHFDPKTDTEDVLRSKYEACMRDEESMEVVLDIVKNNRFRDLPSSIFNLESNPDESLRFLTFANDLGAARGTPAQLVQQLKKPMQTYLDDVYNK